MTMAVRNTENPLRFSILNTCKHRNQFERMWTQATVVYMHNTHTTSTPYFPYGQIFGRIPFLITLDYVWLFLVHFFTHWIFSRKWWNESTAKKRSAIHILVIFGIGTCSNIKYGFKCEKLVAFNLSNCHLVVHTVALTNTCTIRILDCQLNVNLRYTKNAQPYGWNSGKRTHSDE